MNHDSNPAEHTAKRTRRRNAARGLCADCRWARQIVSGRGSTFLLCEQHQTNPRFPKYPPLPVLACAAHEPTSEPRNEPTNEPHTEQQEQP